MEYCTTNIANTATDSVLRKRSKLYNKSGCCNRKGEPTEGNLFFVCEEEMCSPNWRGKVTKATRWKIIPDLNQHGKAIMRWFSLNCESIAYIYDGRDVRIVSCPENREDDGDCDTPGKDPQCACPSCLVTNIRAGRKYLCALREKSKYDIVKGATQHFPAFTIERETLRNYLMRFFSFQKR